MTRQSYDRQPGESSKAYSAFVVYRDMGGNRSIETAWKQHSQTDKVVPGYFSAWATDYNWVARAAAYDDYIEAEARKKIERDTIRRKADMLKRHAQTGKALQSKGLEYLQAKGVDRSSDAIAAIRAGVDMERKAEGLPEWIFEIVNADDDQLAREYAGLLAALGGAGSGDESAGDEPAEDSG